MKLRVVGDPFLDGVTVIGKFTVGEYKLEEHLLIKGAALHNANKFT